MSDQATTGTQVHHAEDDAGTYTRMSWRNSYWIIALMLSGSVLIRMQSHRRELLLRMQIIEDVNHHVRNALTAITLSSSLRHDPELNARVRDACDRIDWMLKRCSFADHQWKRLRSDASTVAFRPAVAQEG